jgi:hypothetical protein
MMSESSRFIQRPVTYTYTAPSGAILVVRNVPAEVYEDRNGREEITYRIDVAEKLDQLIDAKLATAKPGAVEVLSFDELPVLPYADYTFKWSGPGENFERANIQTWRRIFDKTYNAFLAATRSITGKISPIEIPAVAYLARSSIVIGLRTTDQARLFSLDYSASEIPDKALQLIMDAGRWLSGEGELPPEIMSDVAALETLLLAVEQLSPSDEKTTVSLQKVGLDSPVHFTQEKRSTAKQKRIDIRLSSPGKSLRVDLEGIVSALDVQGRVTLRDVTKTAAWHSKTADCVFEIDLLPTLLENFAKAVRISAIQKETAGKWSTLEVMDVTRSQRAKSS